MSFYGRDILIESCKDVIESLKQDYMRYGKQFANHYAKSIDIYDIEDTLDIVFESLLLKEQDRQNLYNMVKKTFSNDEILAICVVNSALSNLHYKFIQEISSKEAKSEYLVYFANAIENMRSILDKSQSNNATLHQSNQQVKPSIKQDGFIFFENIADSFKKVQEVGGELKFLNLYNGVSVECDARVISVEDDRAMFRVSLTQILAMKEEGNAYIAKSDNYENNIKADIVSIDLTNCTVLLNNFVRMKNMFANQRKFPRVHPNKFTQVRLTNDSGVSIEGKLYDISQGGIGVVSTENAGFKNGDELVATFLMTMPKSLEVVSIDLRLTLVVALNYQGSMRYCCQITKEQPCKEKIIEFSKLRVAETLEELHQKVDFYR